MDCKFASMSFVIAGVPVYCKHALWDTGYKGIATGLHDRVNDPYIHFVPFGHYGKIAYPVTILTVIHV